MNVAILIYSNTYEIASLIIFARKDIFDTVSHVTFRLFAWLALPAKIAL